MVDINESELVLLLSIRKLIIFHEVSFVLTALNIDVSHGGVELLLRFDVAFSQKKDLRFMNLRTC